MCKELIEKSLSFVKDNFNKLGCYFCFKVKELESKNRIMQEEHQSAIKLLEEKHQLEICDFKLSEKKHQRETEELNLHLKTLRTLPEELGKKGFLIPEAFTIELTTLIATLEAKISATRRVAEWIEYNKNKLIDKALEFLVQEYPNDFKTKKQQKEVSSVIGECIDYMYDCLSQGTLSYELDVGFSKPIFQYQQALKFVRKNIDTTGLSQLAIQELETCFDHLIALIEKI